MSSVLILSDIASSSYVLSTTRRAEFVRWVAESLRPFKIIKDRGFQCLMKTGRPGTYIPSERTVSRDVKAVFARVRQRIAKMLRVSLMSLFSVIMH